MTRGITQGMTPPATALRPKVVCLGGGHGLFAMLSALRDLDVDLTAVVTVADDGGSSGRLRRELPGLLPPGDLRMALAALAADGDFGTVLRDTFQHRFTGQGVLAGHPAGNILLAGLAEVTGDPVAALDAAARLLGACGRVLPMAREPLELVADVAGLDEDPSAVRQIRGQVAVAGTPGEVRAVRLYPDPVAACPEAVAAVAEADLITLGPGSWFTSVLPHLMIPELAEAIVTSPAHRLVVLNLVPQPGETEGFSPAQHIEALSAHAPDLRIDTVLADRRAVPLPQRLYTATEQMGATLVLDDIGDGDLPRHHAPSLARALDTVLAGLRGRWHVPRITSTEPTHTDDTIRAGTPSWHSRTQ